VSKAAHSLGSGHPSLRDVVSDAVGYWEPRRIGYNAVLALVVSGWLAFTWPRYREALTWHSLLLLLVLAVLANVCYCAAYLADIPLQYSEFRDRWRRWRWGMWLLGVLFAAAIACYWIADEIDPFVN
jgi:hypothetical protein